MVDARARAPRRRAARPSSRGSTLAFAGALGAALLAGWSAWTYVTSVRRLLLVYPAPWPDEALFADVAIRWLRHGVFGTDLYREFLPGIDAHYFLTPPLYSVLLAGVFAVAGVGLVPLRLASVAAGLGAAAALYGMARRTGLARWAALVPPSLLALDAVFLRGSLIGRMDALTLALVLAAFWLALDPAEESAGAGRGARLRWGLLGLVAGAAIVSHPLGLLALAALLRWVPGLALPRAGPGAQATARGATPLPLFAVGVGIALLPWAVYAMLDPHNFATQMGQQLLRKSRPDFLGVCLPMHLRQWGVGGAWVAAALVAGLAGLSIAALRNRALRWLVIAQAALLTVTLTSCEQWYGFYTLPLTFLGLVHGARGTAGRGATAWAVRVIFVVIAGGFTLLNVSRVAALRAHAFEFDYSRWCHATEAAVPQGSTVLMESIPTPYFGLLGRSDLKLRLYPPRGFDVPVSVLEQGLDRVEVVIVGRASENAAVSQRIERGQVLAEIGPEQGLVYPAAIVRIRPGAR